ncbi:MAG: T9SS type A sorting domain-containing protein [Chlorobi bacterium]|nr:T9SS type A sorting domain-containing protein [Chlorobiota bacterium]MCI0716798.1 T9SS type A sorting domain-containing protein [Chlorobiota bacterium]
MKDLIIYINYCIFIGFLFSTHELQTQWTQTNGLYTEKVSSFASIDTNLFARTFDNGVFLTINNGVNWTAVNSGLSNNEIRSLTTLGILLFAGTSNGVSRSTNNGTNWIGAGLTNEIVYSLKYSNGYLLAGIFGDIYRSSNFGTNWTVTAPTGNLTYAFTDIGPFLFAGTEGDGVFRSTNNGTNWLTVNSGLPFAAFVLSLVFNDSIIFAGTFYDGVFRSNNLGANWIEVNSGLTHRDVYAFAVYESNLFAATYFGGVFLSTNNGTSCAPVNTGLTDLNIRALKVHGVYLYAGTWGSGVWRRPLSEIINSVIQISGNIPFQFNLYQNYPNPFNPATQIKFDIPKLSNVKLIVYDALGRVVAELVNEQLNAGSYSYDWNASDYPSGVYFYKLITDDYAQTRIMVLIK